MAKAAKRRVSEGALIKRVNRKLAQDGEQLSKSRSTDTPTGPLYDQNTGEFYVRNVDRNFVVNTHVDIEDLARELGVLSKEEALAP